MRLRTARCFPFVGPLNGGSSSDLHNLRNKLCTLSAEHLDIYDAVLAYEDLEQLDNTEKVAFVDMAGNRNVLERIHHHFTDNMMCSCGVGITHWKSRDGQAPSTLPGAKPTMFFAPNQIQKRNQDWGPGKFQEELTNAWRDFLGVVDGWVTINHTTGPEELKSTYEEVLGGASPDQSYVLSL